MRRGQESSLLSVLMGFLPYRGALLVNGRELCAFAPSLWRERLRWVSQNPALPAVTLRDNILLGGAGRRRRAIDAGVKDAYVAEFLAALPDGLDNAVGEDAGLLSVGQAQRVALARALIRTPDLAAA